MFEICLVVGKMTDHFCLVLGKMSGREGNCVIIYINFITIVSIEIRYKLSLSRLCNSFCLMGFELKCRVSGMPFSWGWHRFRNGDSTDIQDKGRVP